MGLLQLNLQFQLLMQYMKRGIMNILLSVSGSIACYKSFDLVRLLIKNGHQVRVVLTNGALRFLKADLFKYLGCEEVYGPEDDFNLQKTEQMESSVLHVELAKWLDKLVIYPASANTISNLAFGRAEDLLSSIFLAKREDTQTIFFPAMNTQMYLHPITKENINLLKRLTNSGKTFICPPKEGELICKDKGVGKVRDIEEAAILIETLSFNEKKKSILITTGATIAPIDPVRYVTNPSSGKTGFALAKDYLSLGYKVKVIAGIYATKDLEKLNLNPDFDLERVTTTSDMLESVKRNLNNYDLYISSAAISDLEFSYEETKLKKSQLLGSIPFNKAPDVLKYVIENKPAHLKTVGFAAETELNEKTLNEKWERKPVDLLVGTSVHSGADGKKIKGFGVNECHYKIFKDGKVERDLTLLKSDLSKLILEELKW